MSTTPHHDYRRWRSTWSRITRMDDPNYPRSSTPPEYDTPTRVSISSRAATSNPHPYGTESQLNNLHPWGTPQPTPTPTGSDSPGLAGLLLILLLPWVTIGWMAWGPELALGILLAGLLPVGIALAKENTR